MANSVLASMVISLGLESQGVTTGINEANRSLLQFQGSADKLKGVNLSSLKANFDKQITALATLRKQAKEYQKALSFAKSEVEVKALNRQLDQTYAEMNRIKNLGRTSLGGVGAGASSAAKSMDKLKGSAGAVNMEFARIIQDAPYGMMGIGNNIQQLTANFKQLRAQSSSTGVALKATFASMITPASLLTLGIAAATSAWTYYQMSAQKSANATETAAEAIREAEQATEDYISSLDAMSRARVRGAQDAQKELVRLRELYRITQDVSISIDTRRKAVDELQQLFPSYFKNLKDEEILVGNAKTAYEDLTKSILKRARGQAAEEEMVNIEKQRLGIIRELKGVDEELYRTRIANEEKMRKLLAKAPRDIAIQAEKTRAQEEESAIIAKKGELERRNLQLYREELSLQKYINQEVAAAPAREEAEAPKTNYMKELVEGWNLATKQAILFGASYDELGVKADLLKNTMVGLMDQGLGPQNSLIKELKSTYDLFASQTLPTTAQTAIDKFASTDLSKLRMEIASTAQTLTLLPVQLQPMSEQMKSFFDKMAADAEGAMGKIELDAASMANMMQQFIGGSLVQVGEALGNIFSGVSTGANALEQFGRGILGSLGGIMKEFGKQLIMMGIGKEALDKMFKFTGGGAGAIAAGILLVGAGTALSNSMDKSVGNLSGGGGGGLPSMSGRAYQSPQPSSSFSTTYDGPDQIELFIQRDKLVAFMDQGNYKTRRQRG